jgi:hypothetical protein
MQSSASINLIKTKTSVLDDILKWALSVGRLLIILTELVAFTTFIYRFSLDRTLIDLHETIKQEQEIVASLKDKEAEYRNLQERLADIKNVSTYGNRNSKILADVINETPNDITFNSFKIENNTAEIDTNIQSISSLTNFLAVLRDYPQSSSVSIERIDNQSLTNSINVIIVIKLKEAKKI